MSLIALLLELLQIAPTLIGDGTAAAQQIKSAPDAAAKSAAVVAGIEHVATTVAPLLK